MVGAARVFLFGRYRLIPDRRALFRNGQETSIRSRAFDLLLVLVERRDRVVSKEELIKLVWAGRVVDEGNLTVHIAALRKLLGKGVIATLPGRGYRFVAPVEEATSAESASPEAEQRPEVTPSSGDKPPPTRAPFPGEAMPSEEQATCPRSRQPLSAGPLTCKVFGISSRPAGW